MGGNLRIDWNKAAEDMRGACGGYLPIMCDSRWGEKDQLVYCIGIYEERNDGDPALGWCQRRLREIKRIEGGFRP